MGILGFPHIEITWFIKPEDLSHCKLPYPISVLILVDEAAALCMSLCFEELQMVVDDGQCEH